MPCPKHPTAVSAHSRIPKTARDQRGARGDGYGP
eukprot:CAMPEP_0205931716 /NCGR_PEP_ID=MMETSP1325-20131115/27938_1 /ASSEMBLY_ACC=CAM_ASM_000708 /TAXON_ID=236786 /ORGANISM="Florenciella sp., Strain RCC1007" /LENGTH=33 /DNA_ID= /DNA_START= /DNA_END= /DNA_ORIENTATION=